MFFSSPNLFFSNILNVFQVALKRHRSLADVHRLACSDCGETASRGWPWTALAAVPVHPGHAATTDFVPLVSPENALRLGGARSKGC